MDYDGNYERGCLAGGHEDQINYRFYQFLELQFAGFKMMM